MIVLANPNGTVIHKIAAALAEMIHGEAVDVAPPPREVALAPEALARYAGTYQFANYSVEVVPDGHHLAFHFDDGGTVLEFPESDARFFDKTWDMQFEFSKNEKGEFVYVTEHFNGQDEKGRRK